MLWSNSFNFNNDYIRNMLSYHKEELVLLIRLIKCVCVCVCVFLFFVLSLFLLLKCFFFFSLWVPCLDSRSLCYYKLLS